MYDNIYQRKEDEKKMAVQGEPRFEARHVITQWKTVDHAARRGHDMCTRSICRRGKLRGLRGLAETTVLDQ